MTQIPAPGPSPRLPTRGLSPSARAFLGTEAGGSTLLLAAAVIALVWANSPWSGLYDAVWETEFSLNLGGLALDLDLHHWVNDGAMAIFFLVVGLEITREISSGELRDRRTVITPALGAVGGLLVPALIYLLFNPAGEAARGWGIVMSTDTAFVLGILALFGPRCPDRLRLFLLTLAIVDDIGAITIMAVFYTDTVNLSALAVALLLIAGLLGLRWLRVWRLWPYVLVGVLLWLAVYASGVHATLAGVALGLLVPARRPPDGVVQRTAAFGRALREDPDAERARLAGLAVAASVPPNARLQRLLHPWSAFVVVPVFGLANAGVSLSGESLVAAFGSSVTLGVIIALVVGNTVGITLVGVLTLKLGWGILPGGVRWAHLVAAASLAGIGFTISLFITELAFDSEALQDQAKIGILVGSLSAAVLGTVLLRFFGERFSLCTPESGVLPSLPPRPWLEPTD